MPRLSRCVLLVIAWTLGAGSLPLTEVPSAETLAELDTAALVAVIDTLKTERDALAAQAAGEDETGGAAPADAGFAWASPIAQPNASAAANASDAVTRNLSWGWPSFGPPRGTAPRQRLAQCGQAYGRELAEFFHSKEHHRESVARQIAALFHARLAADGRRLASRAPERKVRDKPMVLGIGPGSSGTRSTFMAFALLRLSGQHYRVRFDSQSCRWLQRGWNDAVDDDNVMYWGDTPVSYDWPTLWSRLPNARFLMTDSDADKWRAKRLSFRRGYCHTNKFKPDCLVPLAFSPPKTLQTLFDLNRSSANATRGAWDAFRNFARCAIPKDRLLWMRLADAKNPGELWSSLLAFLGMDAGTRIQDPRPGAHHHTLKLTNASTPFPHWGEHGCDMGGSKCHDWIECPPGKWPLPED